MRLNQFINGLLVCMTIALIIAITVSAARASENTTESRTPGNFSSIDLSGAFEVTLVSGTSCGIQLQGDPDDLSHVETTVHGNILDVSVQDHARLKNSVALVITYVKLDLVDCSGAIVLSAPQPVRSKSLTLGMSGVCKATLEIETQQLNLDISGSGNVNLKGKAMVSNIDISGAGEVNSGQLETETCRIDVSGTGNAELQVRKSLHTEISGTGTIRYHGDPEVQKSVSGTGRVIKI